MNAFKQVASGLVMALAGAVQDAETGLTYMQQRYYDPGIGRFLSVDPVTADVSTGANFNRYKYAENNPYRFTDPDGRQSSSIERAIDRDIADRAAGRIDTAEYNDRALARGGGGAAAFAGVATVAVAVEIGAVAVTVSAAGKVADVAGKLAGVAEAKYAVGGASALGAAQNVTRSIAAKGSQAIQAVATKVRLLQVRCSTWIRQWMLCRAILMQGHLR